jgi:hypothetical protein
MTGQTLRMLGWYNLRLTAHASWLLSAALLAAAPFFMSPELMDRGHVAGIGELLVSFIGLMVFPHLALLENGGIGETLYAKKVRHSPVFLFRWLVTIVYAFGVIAAFLVCLHWRGAEFDLAPMIAGVTMTAVAIGTCGMTVALLLRSPSAGYIAGFAWYLLDFTTKGKLTGPFYLFGLLKSDWDPDKWLLAGLSLALAALCAFLLPRGRLD